MVRGRPCPNSNQCIPKSIDEKTPRVVPAYTVRFPARQSTASDITRRFAGIPESRLVQDNPPSLVIQIRPPCSGVLLVGQTPRLGGVGSIAMSRVKPLSGPNGKP